MAKTFIFGINDSIDGCAMLSTERLYALTGHNVGNLAFHYAMVKILGGGLQAKPWHTDPAEIDALGDLGVMPCANQLGPHADYGRLGERFAAIKARLLAVGLGAQGDSYDAIPPVPEGTLAWVREIVRHRAADGPNIGVRGPFTLRVLEHYGLGHAAVVTGCPTLFINPDPRLGELIASRIGRPPRRIAIAAGHQKWTHLGKLEASLTAMIGPAGGSYIVQSPIEMVHLARGEAGLLSEEALTECRDYACPHLTLDEFKDWSRAYARAFFNVSEWMEHLRGFDYVVGPRIHGVMLGLQAGIPSLCIAHDSRTRELCETLGVPFVLADDVRDGLAAPDIPDLLRFRSTDFSERRQVLARQVDALLRNNGVPPSRWLEPILSVGQTAGDEGRRREIAGLARSLAAEGRYVEAASAWEEFRAVAPGEPLGYLEGSAALRASGRMREAEDLVATGLTMFPHSAELLCEHARFAFERRDFDAALARWRAAISRFPDHAPGTIGLIQSLRVAGQVSEAESLAETAGLRAPGEPAFAVEYARGAVGRREWELAIVRWAEVRARFPARPEGYAGGMQGLRMAGRVREAATLGEIAVAKFEKSPEIWREFARIADATQEWPKAAARWARLNELAPEEVDGYVARARALRLGGFTQEADAALTAALERFPRDHSLLLDDLRCLALRGRWSTLLSRCRSARQIGLESLEIDALEARASEELEGGSDSFPHLRIDVEAPG